MQKPEEIIELVKKWLANPESVSKEELKANRKSALAAALPAALTEASIDAAACAYDAHANYDDALSAYDALSASAALAALAAYVDATDVAYYWVNRYEKLNGKLQDAKKEK